MAADRTPGQAAPVPAAYARWIRASEDVTDEQIAADWRIESPGDRKFWTALDAEIASLRADLADAEAQVSRWPKCPDGCGCLMDGEDADRRECGCDGPCNQECRENGYPDAPSYRDLAVTAERERIHRMALDLRATFTSPSGKVMPFEELIRRAPSENAALLLGVVKGDALEGGDHA